MRTTLAELLATKDVILADGATGTNYFQRGLMSGHAPELWNEEHPEHVQGLHREFVEAGADIIVAQGSEAGGHGAVRATMTLVPEIASLLQRSSPDTLLVAAGGIADGRGLAAALALGADGVLMGSRFWACSEALTHPRHQAAALASSGDQTIRQGATDIARGYDWPSGFTARVLRNSFVEEWEHRPAEHRALAASLRPAYQAAVAAGDPDAAGVWVGEATGLIEDVASAAAIIERTVAEAEQVISRLGTMAGQR
jgi:nitronate monooxygenase